MSGSPTVLRQQLDAFALLTEFAVSADQFQGQFHRVSHRHNTSRNRRFNNIHIALWQFLPGREVQDNSERGHNLNLRGETRGSVPDATDHSCGSTSGTFPWGGRLQYVLPHATSGMNCTGNMPRPDSG